MPGNMPYYDPMIDHDAYILREGTGTSGVVETARLAAGRLADHLIPKSRNLGRTEG